MSKYQNWTSEQIEEYRLKNWERIKKKRQEQGRDRTKEYSQRNQRCKEDPEYRAKRYKRKPIDKSSIEYTQKIAKINKRNREKRLLIKTQCVNYLGGKCLRCNNSFHPNVYDFHHRNPNDKENNLASLLKKERFKMTDNLKIELDKCELVCSNCHRMIHLENGY